ncbi:phosphomannomutase [Rhodothalassium salexigens DSM 2132]|uniref:Phosphomannomutase n=1 Tax=Rhodothalassium salexigens DSM 2132 TaxID=1188247 RepID=A0A4V2SP64_RHOSA|nr:phosphomannomutase/phosphoglucomutase [Rhodothalassium salexigens]MBB4211726.1 phosphomannomutase [Rhodothalassium salexigens DSM 2132]MBK1639187.1 phosphomannomutase [Rhodothalassium salexigens DSM 2132]TCP33976.1 phosphomannomutase [Rhodothalassium salexigens DSM 2132]
MTQAPPYAFHPSILREYDIRGVVGDTLHAADAEAVGRAFGTVLGGAGKTVAVGYDGRASSPELMAAMTRGLASTGCTVKAIGLGPTPMLYYAAHALGTDGGVMITGSHNPPEYNGIKMVRAAGPVYGDQIAEIGRIAAAGAYATGAGRVEDVPVFDDYIERLAGDYRGGALKVAWDPGNGAAGDAVTALVARLPGSHVVINGEIDGRFPNHHPDPTVEANLAQLKQAVDDHGCDLGLAFDGDGDRVGAVDARGRVVWADEILAILTREVVREIPDATVIADVKTSQIAFDEIAKAGARPMMWKTGHSLIKAKMAEIGSPLSGEMSGHIFFKHRFYGVDDGLYAGLRLMEAVSNQGGDLAALKDALPVAHNTPEVRFDCPEERKVSAVADIARRLADQGAQVVDIDGVRVTTPDGWWLVRASNTQPALTARVEAWTPEGLDRLRAEARDHLNAVGLTPPADL